ncbi:MAG TPA: succinate--CoA ligase subunit alpha [Chloroflexota bacterium]|nr:succinate--CoA ligase subunit alpha [Chloroflexota bacterium]
MSILINKDTRVVVHGITGREGAFHSQKMIEYGTQVVAGVTPGKGGAVQDGVPVFESAAEAVKATGANTSIIFVPAPFAADSAVVAAEAGVKLVVVITDGIPTLDMIRVVNYIRPKGVRLIGPNCPGIISPGEAKVGIMPAEVYREGPIGVISRSGTLTYETCDHITNMGMGVSTCIGIGGDPIIGTRFLDALKLFREDDETRVVVLIGEIGGSDEEMAAAYIRESRYPKPVVAFISGRSAPPGKRMGHAGAIISGGTGTPQAKVKAFEEAGVPVGNTLEEVVQLAKERLG